MTIDDLVALYETHSTCHKLDQKSHAMRAVVKALRDEMTKLGALEFQDSWAVLRKFDEILGDAGAEKVGTHGTPELDEDARKLEAMGQDPGATFATDPAPAVCEWTRTSWGPPPPPSPLDALYTPRCDADYLCSVPDSGICRRCGLPIKFAEAKE